MLHVQPLELNRTSVEFPRERTIAEEFSRQAHRSPNAVAVIAGIQRLTYRELDERSNRLARHLQRLGVGPETLVGVAVERSEILVISLLAILKAGGAYVPLDPAYPRERLSWIIEDSGMPVIITTAHILKRLQLELAGITTIDAEDVALDAESLQEIHAAATSAALAYVIYTSGSTGKPKGVMVENRNVISLFAGMDLTIGCRPGVWLAVTSVCFDISVLELLWTLTRGFTVVMHSDDKSATVAEQILSYGVTHLQMTPSLARLLTLDTRDFAALGLLKQILLGGEAVPPSLIRQLRQVFKGEIHNMYGPTETTIWSTTHLVEEVGCTVSIGKPIANTQIFLLSEKFEPVSEGCVGEIFIAGDGVARGYWHRPDLTEERFLRIAALSKQQIYRTGDLARAQVDGNLEFLGRADYQIKLRGHRIEPGEIETILEQHPGVRQAVIVAREDREGDQRLIAYLVAENTGADAVRALRSALAKKLPDFMVPSSFIFLSSLPLTDNGKIDRKALLKLPPPALTPAVNSGEPESIPATGIETTISHTWQDALGISNVGLHDNFFDLGAHSLTVAEVHAKLQQQLGLKFALVDLFQYSTVHQLAAHLAGVQPQGQLSDRAQRRRMALLR
jgi:amino acid adenylation domain-containing protein